MIERFETPSTRTLRRISVHCSISVRTLLPRSACWPGLPRKKPPDRGRRDRGWSGAVVFDRCSSAQERVHFRPVFTRGHEYRLAAARRYRANRSETAEARSRTSTQLYLECSESVAWSLSFSPGSWLAIRPHRWLGNSHWRRSFDQPVAVGVGDGLSSIPQSNLGEEMIDVSLDGPFAHNEVFCDFGVGHSVGH